MYPEEENFEPAEITSNSPPSFDYLNNPPNPPLTQSITRQLHEHYSINFVEDDLREKLNCICEKLYRHDVPFNSLNPDEQLLWSAYEIDDIMFFLTGDQKFSPDYT